MADDTTSTAELAPAPAEIRSKLALALDVDDLVVAVRWARELRPWFGVAKVGLELYSAVGPDAIGALTDLGYDVFCDLKLHDIPTTVGRAARVLGAMGTRYLNFHAQGGVDSGCGGIVCAAEDVREAKHYGPRLVAVVPGIRPTGVPLQDHARAATPRVALDAGADVLVIGRPVTQADDPRAAAAAIAAELA